MLVRIEEVHSLTHTARGRLVSRALHISNGVEPVAIRNSSAPDTFECLIELSLRHRERQVLTAGGAPRRDLNDKTGCDSKHRERLAIAVVFQSDYLGVE